MQRLLITESRIIYLILFYAMLNGIIILTLPLGIQAIINYIMGGRVSSSWVILIIIVMVGLILSGIIQIAQMKMTERLQQRIFTKSSFELAVRIPRIKLGAIQNRYAPEMVNQFFDTVTLQKGLSKLLVDYPTAALQIIFGLILISIYHPVFVFFSFGVVVLIYLIFKFTGPQGVETSLNESTHKYQVAHWLEELARTMGTFKLAGNTRLPLIRVDKLVMGYLDFRVRHFNILILQYKAMVAFKVIVVVALLIIGSLLLIQNEISIGQFVAAEIIIILIMNSIEKIIVGLETVYDTLTSIEKLGALTDLPLEEENNTYPVFPADQFGLSIVIENLRFRYPSTRDLVINHLSLRVGSGQKVVLLGTVGSGKSTLMQLLMGFYEDYEGLISYNGLSLSTLRLDRLRCEVGDNIWQEHIFKGSLRENLTMGDPDISDDQILEAISHLGLDDRVTLLPNGLDTELFPGGIKLPGTVAKKIILARSIMGNPRMLLLDLEVDFLKKEERKKLYDHVFSHPCTVLAATSDDEFMKRADKVIFMVRGNVAFEGNYEQFKQSPYAESLG
ncbi:MAG: ATP-binding cassette domain-containing protein [Cryomorphaceae bacterium]|nr:MAG: ATP-binding cassette domain-containing protein [Cryomorphaceae bacterium]